MQPRAAAAFRVAAAEAPFKARRAIPSQVEVADQRRRRMAAAARPSSSSSSLPAAVAAVLLLLFLIMAPAPVSARPTALIVFGDSTVDAGNNNFWPTMARGNYPPYGRDFPGGRPTGRFCNGRLSTDIMSQALGLGRGFVPAYLDPAYSIKDFAIGVCFASAGTGIDDATAGVFKVIPFSKQMAMFREYKSRLAADMGAEAAEAVVSGAVYVISIGSNDYALFTLSGRQLQFGTTMAYTSFLTSLARGYLTELYSLGARKVAFLGLGPLGCFPPNRAGLACNEMANVQARAFNAGIKQTVDALRAQLPGGAADFRLGDLYPLMDAVVRNPVTYGFARADVGCCGSGRFEMGFACTAELVTCPVPNAYVFFDAVHTTEHTNLLVAEYLLNTSLAGFAS